MKILVVDDSTTMLRIISNTLKRIGVKDIDTAEDGQMAYKLYELQDELKPYDIIITDWNMPNMNGLELVKKIRSTDTDTPIIMITTEGGKKEVITALRAGCSNYIVKPFTPEVLRGKLQEIMGGYNG